MYTEERQGGGILNSLMIKVAFTIFLLSVSTASCAATTSSISTTKCVEKVLGVDVVKVDDRNHRFFIASKIVDASAIKGNITGLEECFKNTEWQQVWSLSVFAEAKYAGYKDEANIIQYHKDNLWAKAYLLEYDHANRSLTKNPAVNPKQFSP